jgi:hypothetical protein
VKQLFLIFALFSSVFAFKTHSPVLGPNIEYGMLGALAPAGLREAFVPQAKTSFDFAWLEPLGASGYGSFEPNKTKYIRFLAGAELSPFYGTVRAGIGFAPLPYPFSILELRIVYANENLFWSDVEMAMKPEDKPSIEESWNAGYIFDSFYRNSKYSQIQSFDTQLGGIYFGSNFDISFFFHFMLIDINSDYEKKSFDYMRGIPLYSRDYLIRNDFSATYRFDERLAWNLSFFEIFSGKQLSLSKTYNKEPLAYHIILTGPLWKLNKNGSYISLSPGFFIRTNSDGDKFFGKIISDSFAERFLISAEYRYFWNFKFGKE